jgi:RNA polymerase sigma factor (sigma-70 family)
MKLVLTENQYRVLLFESTNFGEIYKKYYKNVYRSICYPMSNNDADLAEDYCQSGFIKAYENFHKHDPSRNTESWLKRLIKNHILDMIRKRKLDTVRGAEEISRADEVIDDPNLIMGKYTEKDIKNAIDKLPLNQKKALEMFYFQNMSHEEMAKELGISTGTTKSNLFKAKAKLKKHLENIKGDY